MLTGDSEQLTQAAGYMIVGKFNSLIEKWRNSTGQSKAIQTRHNVIIQAMSEATPLIGGTVSSWSLKCSCLFWLPPELLASIFLEYVQSYKDKLYYNFTQVSPWIAVSYICRYGCNVALNSAYIWVHLFIVSPQWMDELLRRSKSAPLIVHVDFNMFRRDTSTICSSSEKILENMEHIQDLWIDCPYYGDFVEMLSSKLIANVPSLWSLHLCMKVSVLSH